MIHQLPLFGEDEDRIESEPEVLDLARGFFRLSAQTEGEPEGEPPGFIVRTRERRATRAAELGLVARWSQEFGFVEIHDPTTGERHDLPTKAAPGWAKREAGKRKRLWRTGDRRAFELTRADMEEIWAADHPPVPPEEGIIEEHPLAG
jgi:hypothetical protein